MCLRYFCTGKKERFVIGADIGHMLDGIEGNEETSDEEILN